MYEHFYNLRERPFSLTPDPSYLYPSAGHREALSHLRYGIESYAGFIVITGEIGCGKTTLLQAVVRSLDQQTAIARLVNTTLDERELLEAVMLDFGLEPAPRQSKPFLLHDLGRYLVDQRAAGRLSLVVVDEAQNLSVPALEELRMLSNLETEKSKLVQIVLVGQPELKELLGRPELEQLRQRVTVNYHLRPLGPEDTHAYVNHRLRRAAIGVPLEFPPDVTTLIYQSSGGVARKVNVLADAILLFGYGADQRAIDVPLAEEAIREVNGEPTWPAPAAAASSAPAPASTPSPAPAPPREAAAIAVDLRPAPVAPAASPAPDLPRATFGPVWGAAVEPPPIPEPRTTSITRFPTPSYRLLADPPRPPAGLWKRLRRSMFGTPKPVLEDQEV